MALFLSVFPSINVDLGKSHVDSEKLKQLSLNCFKIIPLGKLIFPLFKNIKIIFSN